MRLTCRFLLKCKGKGTTYGDTAFGLLQLPRDIAEYCSQKNYFTQISQITQIISFCAICAICETINNICVICVTL